MPEKESTRDAYGKALVELGHINKNIIVLEADISKSTRTCYFAKEFPERFINVGVAEQNMMVVAAGMSTCEKIPFVSTYSIFSSARCCEQIRTSIAYPKLNVKIAVSHGGLTPGSDGVTHQATEDLGIMRTIPNMTLIMPADSISTRELVLQASIYDGPVYLRFTRDPVPVIYDVNQKFTIGKALRLKYGKDLTIIAIGDMVYYALEAAKCLEKSGIIAGVLDMHTLKPLDEEAVLEAASETGAIITVEDHNIINGLGSAVSELVVENYPVPVARVGIRDTFAESGEYELLLTKYGLSVSHIVAASQGVLKRKKG